MTFQMSAQDTAIELKGIVKSYGAKRIVDDVSLTIGKGLFVTLLGPSGCGKSTLLRIIVGLVTPEAGQVVVEGRDISRDVPHSRPIKMVFQDYALFPHMTVAENIGFGCEMKGMKRDSIVARAQELLALVRLPGLGGRYPDELSGGQRQRVALARALAPDPISLLLDEPLGALDLNLREEMRRELKAIQRRTGKTFVFVTHDQDEAMSMSDLVAVMRNGRIEQLDVPERLYARPVNAFVARFVGTANMLAGKLIKEDGPSLLVEMDGRQFALPRSRVTSRRAPRPGEEVQLVIRPEAFSFGTGGLEFSGRIEERTFLGGRVQLRLRTGEGRSLLVDAPPHSAEGLGETITLSLPPDRLAILAEEPADA
jgi:spermidine/putrescine transport system ATP-binding protein